MLVIDAGVALKWFAAEPDSASAGRLLKAPVRLAAPDLALAEIANGLRRKERGRQLSADLVQQAVAKLPQVLDPIVPAAPHLLEAVRLSQKLNHSVYDCLYLVVAQSLLTVLVTADAKFTAKLASTPYASHVVLLRDWKG